MHWFKFILCVDDGCAASLFFFIAFVAFCLFVFCVCFVCCHRTACRSHSITIRRHRRRRRRRHRRRWKWSGEGQIKCQNKNEKLVQTRRRGGNKWIKLAATAPARAYERLEALGGGDGGSAGTTISQKNGAKRKRNKALQRWAFIFMPLMNANKLDDFLKCNVNGRTHTTHSGRWECAAQVNNKTRTTAAATKREKHHREKQIVFARLQATRPRPNQTYRCHLVALVVPFQFSTKKFIISFG